MMLLKLLLSSSLAIIVVSAIKLTNNTGHITFVPFNVTKQDEIIILENYELIYNLCLNEVYVEAKITFMLRNSTNLLGIYTSGATIMQYEITLKHYNESESTSNNHSVIFYEPSNFYKGQYIYILEFSKPLPSKQRFELAMTYYDVKPDDMIFLDEYYHTSPPDGSHLYRILDSSHGINIVSLTSEDSSLTTKINLTLSFPYQSHVFTNALNVSHRIINNSSVDSKLAWSPIPIDKAMLVVGINFQETHYRNMTFWHSPAVKNEIMYALHISYELWSHHIPKNIDQNKWLSTPYVIIAPNDVYTTGSSLGMIVYRESDIVFDAKMNFSGYFAAIQLTVSYELSRQILRFPVYPSSWMAKCLLESLAMFLHYNIFDRMNPKLHSADSQMSYRYVVHILQPSLYNDINLRLKPVSYGSSFADEIDKSLLPRLYYHKVSALLRMMSYVFDFRAMQEGIYEYIQQYAFRKASDLNFWEHMPILQKHEEMQINENVTSKQFMHKWLTQKHYPVIYIELKRTKLQHNVTVILRQRSSVDENCVSTNCTATNNTWLIPLKISLFRSNIIHHFPYNFTLFDNHTKNIPFTQSYDFIIFNMEQIGYYRVNYDEKTWLRIAQFLNYGNYTLINVLNRAQIIDDAYYFMIKGEMSWATFLHLIRYLKRETSYVAWYPMINILNYLLPFLKHPTSYFIKPSLLEILEGLLHNIGFEEHEDDDDMIRSLKILGTWWACKLGHRECRERANRELKRHLENPEKNTIKPWWENWVYCAGLMLEDKHGFNMMLTHLNNTRRASLLKYMACSEDGNNFKLLINLFTREKNLEEIYDKFKSAYHHISPFVQQHAKNKDILRYIVDNFKHVTPRGLRSTHFLVDIIMNLHSTQLLTEMEDVIEVNNWKLFRTIVRDLIDIQKMRINKIWSTYRYLRGNKN